MTAAFGSARLAPQPPRGSPPTTCWHGRSSLPCWPRRGRGPICVPPDPFRDSGNMSEVPAGFLSAQLPRLAHVSGRDAGHGADRHLGHLPGRGNGGNMMSLKLRFVQHRAGLGAPARAPGDGRLPCHQRNGLSPCCSSWWWAWGRSPASLPCGSIRWASWPVKLFSEAVEAIDLRPVEGVRATGAGAIEEIVFGASSRRCRRCGSPIRCTAS